jgi:hypothetical protein
MAQYVKSFPDERICFAAFKTFNTTFNFLTRDIPKNMRRLSANAADIIPIRNRVSKNILFMMEPPYQQAVLPMLQEFYPWGDYKVLTTPTGLPMVYTCALTKEEVNRIFGITVSVYRQDVLEKKFHIRELKAGYIRDQIQGSMPVTII